jgi:hypothetical protein
MDGLHGRYPGRDDCDRLQSTNDAHDATGPNVHQHGNYPVDDPFDNNHNVDSHSASQFK